jgi:hypothetical protein
MVAVWILDGTTLLDIGLSCPCQLQKCCHPGGNWKGHEKIVGVQDLPVSYLGKFLSWFKY